MTEPSNAECGALFEAHIDGALYSDVFCDLPSVHYGPHSNLAASLQEAMTRVVFHSGPCPSCTEEQA